MLDGGADPLYLGRRLLRMSWEDIGLADVNAQSIANNALQTYERLGSPEGELALASCVIYLAVTPKSNSTEIAYNKVRDFIKKDIAREVPLHLRNAPTKLMAELGYGKEYKYVHDYPNHYIPDENYWPEDMIQQQFYTATNQGLESRIVERLRFLKSLAEKKK
jgi:putative ATPase